MTITIELTNGYTITGPKTRESEALSLAEEINQEMKTTFDEYLNEGESIAMDMRDDTVYEYEDKLQRIGFQID
jgi:hypothetical protein